MTGQIDRFDWTEDCMVGGLAGDFVRYDHYESALSALREENERLRELLANARDYVDAALTHERAAFKGYEHASDISFMESELASIDAALTPKEQGNG